MNEFCSGLALQSYFIKIMRPEEGVNADMDHARIRVHNSAKHPFQVITNGLFDWAQIKIRNKIKIYQRKSEIF